MLAWIRGAGLTYLLGGLLLCAVVLFTLIVIHRTNTRLLQLHAQGHGGNARSCWLAGTGYTRCAACWASRRSR
jgi:hypothetical protein